MKMAPISDSDLHAYADELLPESRRAEVEAYLATDIEAAERVRAYAEQNRCIKELFDPVLKEAVPDRLLKPARAFSPRASWISGWSAQRIAAGIVFVAIGAASGWVAHDAFQPSQVETLASRALPAENVYEANLVKQAAIAHTVYSPDARRPVEITAEQEDQLVAWLSKRLGTRIQVPKLGSVGYELIGGRLLPGSKGPVAQFMYHDATGQRLTLYVSNENTGNADTGFLFAQEGPVNVFYWINGNFGYALSAGIDKGELAHVATVVYDQLGNQ
jgi:anti-sigma factor RsiW